MIIDFELFKDQKKLESEYSAYMVHCNKYFGQGVSPNEIFKRLYFAARYLEGTVNGYMLFSKLGLSDVEYRRGVKLFASWLQEIVNKIKESC